MLGKKSGPGSDKEYDTEEEEDEYEAFDSYKNDYKSSRNKGNKHRCGEPNIMHNRASP